MWCCRTREVVSQLRGGRLLPLSGEVGSHHRRVSEVTFLFRVVGGLLTSGLFRLLGEGLRCLLNLGLLGLPHCQVGL